MKNWPRRRKFLLCLVLLLIARLTALLIHGWQSPTPEIALRRMEKQQLIGPTEMITTLHTGNTDGCHVILGRSEHGYTLFQYYDYGTPDSGNLFYFPKTEKATVFSTTSRNVYQDGRQELPIYLFPEGISSVIAAMTLTISNPEGTQTVTLEGQRPDSSFYLFHLPVEDMDSGLLRLVEWALSKEPSGYEFSGTVELRVEFFNTSGEIVDTYSQTITK